MRKVVKQKTVNVRMFPADTVFAAACAANRINGEYLKANTTDFETQVTRIANKELLRSILIDCEQENTIIDADIKMASEVRNYFRCKMMEVLAGTASSFIHTAVNIAALEEFASNNWLGLAFVACLPSSYERGIKFDEAKMQKYDLMSTSQHFGEIGEKVTGKATVIESRFSQNWGVYFVTARFGNNVILFSYRSDLENGSEIEIKGTVKAHRDDFVTQLNRVKLI